MRRTKLPVLTMTFCLAAVVAGCSSKAAEPDGTALAPSGPATTPATPAPTASTSAPADEAGKPAGTRSSRPIPRTTSVRPLDPLPPPTDPACASAVILPVAKRVVDDPTAGLTVQAVEIPVCRNGYARVFTVPARTTQRFEGDQLFLHLVDGAWTLAGRGASIDCGDAGLSPAVTDACTGLGQP